MAAHYDLRKTDSLTIAVGKVIQGWEPARFRPGLGQVLTFEQLPIVGLSKAGAYGDQPQYLTDGLAPGVDHPRVLQPTSYLYSNSKYASRQPFI